MIIRIFAIWLLLVSQCWAGMGTMPGPWIPFGGGGSATLFTDTFTGTNGTLLENHVSDSGHTWTRFSGTAGALQLSNGELVAGSGTTTTIYYSSFTPSSSNYSVTGSLKVITTSSSTANLSIGGRYQAETGYGYFARVSVLAGTVQLYRLGSTATLLGEYSYTFSTGTVYTLTLVMSGSSISVNLNGSLVIGPVSDTTYSSGGVFVRRFSTSVGTAVSLISMSVE